LWMDFPSSYALRTCPRSRVSEVWVWVSAMMGNGNNYERDRYPVCKVRYRGRQRKARVVRRARYEVEWSVERSSATKRTVMEAHLSEQLPDYKKVDGYCSDVINGYNLRGVCAHVLVL
jgi:hypothetical protein